MRETEITIERLTPAGIVNGHFILGDFFFKDSAKFTEKEISTLKTMMSNLSDNGFLKVYELVEYKEMFVDPKFHPNAVKKIFHHGNPKMKVTKEQFPQWIRTDYKLFVEYFIDHVWNWEFKGEETWKDEAFVDCMIDTLDENFFSVVYVETIPNVLNISLNKQQSEELMMSYDGYYPEKMEVKERTILCSETEVLRKLLSLLNL